VTSINHSAFSGCSGLKSIVIPESVTSIDDLAFYGCSRLISITIPKGVTSIGNGAFSGCISLTPIIIPESVTNIGWSPFADCSNLESIKVEAGNTKYDSRNNCNAIIETATNTLIGGCQSTVIPESVTKIDISAFSGCYYLTSITIPTNVTSLGSWAFSGCSNLTSITIPNSVTTIGMRAFKGCFNLIDFYCLAENVPQTYHDSFSSCPIEKVTLHVPAASIDKYKAAMPWSSFGKIVAIEE
jgi:hypothetical protein